MCDRPEGRKWAWLAPVIRFPVSRIVLALAALVLASILWVTLLTWVAGVVLQVLSLVPPQTQWEPQWELMTLPVALHLTYVGYVRLVEQRSPSELARAGAVRELAMGTLVGAALPAAVVGLVAALGFYRVVAPNPWTSLVPPLAAAVSNAYMWECLSRGVLLRITEESLGTWLALLISSLLVGVLLLAFIPSATVVSTVAILAANLLLGAAYLLTRRLWMAIGIHFAWDFTQAGIFGVYVSGTDTDGLLESRLSGAGHDLRRQLRRGSFHLRDRHRARAQRRRPGPGTPAGQLYEARLEHQEDATAVRTVRYGDLTFEQIRDCASRKWLAIVPTGCTEQQGPHLPVDFDTWFAENLCVAASERAARDYRVRSLVLPAFPFGPTPEHRNYGSGYIDIPVLTFTIRWHTRS